MGEVEQLNANGAELGLTEQTGAEQQADSTETGQSSEVPTYEIDGEQVSAEQIKTWRQEHMLQSDYTRKTQELAAQREALKPMQEALSYLQANPDKAQQFYQTLYGQGQEVDPVQQQLHQTQMMVQQLIKDNSLTKVNHILDNIKGDPKYGELYKDPEMEELLLATAMQTGKTTLEDLKGVAERLYNKVTKFKVAAEKVGAQTVVKNLQSPTRKGEAGKGTITPPKDFDPAKSSWVQTRKVAEQFLN